MQSRISHSRASALMLAAGLVFLLVAVVLNNHVLAQTDTTAPGTPRGFDAAGGSTTEAMILTWINPTDVDVSRTNIYLGTTHAYTGTLFATIDAQPGQAGTHTLFGLAAGTEYYLYLTAEDESGNASTTTSELKRTTASPADTTSPGAVTDFTIEAAVAGNTLTLSWTNPGEDDLYRVRIYRSIASSFTPTSANEVTSALVAPGEEGTYTDTGLASGTTYYYQIRTEDNRGNLQTGLFYPSASGTPIAPEPEPEPDPEPEPETPDLFGIMDGDLIRVEGALDIYIVKTVGSAVATDAAKKFKRLILNPEIFNSYGHLRWEDVKNVSADVVDAFTTSDLVLEVNADGSVADEKVYRVSAAVDSDVGEKRWLNMTAAEFEVAGYDWNAIFHINHIEAGEDFYPLGVPITAS